MKTTQPYLRAVKAARQNPECKECVHLSVDKLIYKGKSYTVDSILDLSPAINPASLSTKTTDKSNLVKILAGIARLVILITAQSPLKESDIAAMSNFINRVRVILFKDDETCRKIMATSDPERMLFLGQKLKDFDETRWKYII